MSVWNLVVNKSDKKICGFAESSSTLYYNAATQTYYQEIEIGPYPIPDIGATFDGVLYTPALSANPYFVVKDGGTVVAEGGVVQIPGDGAATKTLTVQKRNGAGNDVAGNDEVIKILPSSVLKLDKLQVIIDSTDGADDFTIGEFPSNYKGCINISLIDSQAKLPSRNIAIEVT